jgi:hypothetical protein
LCEGYHGYSTKSRKKYLNITAMLRCEACRSYVPANEAVTLPVTPDRRKLFARHLNLDENIFLNLPRYRYICQGHFNSTDFYRNQFGQITKLRLSAVPRAVSLYFLNI